MTTQDWSCKLIAHDYLSGVVPVHVRLDKPADLIFADPPYNLGIEYADDNTRDRLGPKEYRRLTEASIIELVNCARPGATFWWMTTEEHADWTGELLSRVVGPRLYRIVWHEAFAQYQGDRSLTRDYRFIFCHRVGDGPVTWNPNAIRVPSARQAIYKDKRANSKGRVPGTTWDFAPDLNIDQVAKEVVDLIRCRPPSDGDVALVKHACLHAALRTPFTPGDVWKFRRLQGTSVDHVDWHPCQLPPELLQRIVKGWSNPGDTVLDGFAGSGSLAKVCKALGRAFVGVDRSPTYLSLIAKELA
ncbi:MAG: site-specific DNA-methyltransferase [Phycisphaerales bacterium]|nr:site-specific DNA-methyltransferase [Phycisphaerales bacterium]